MDSNSSYPLDNDVSTIVYQGWLTIKLRSLFNIRPRHIRYCILSTNSILSFYRFPPSIEDLPIKQYHVLCIIPSANTDADSIRKKFFLLSVSPVHDPMQQSILEISVRTEDEANEWIKLLTLYKVSTTDNIEQMKTIKTISTEKDNCKVNEYPGNKPRTNHGVIQSINNGIHLLRVGASVHRGLENPQGENNCFLNVIIQSIWHLSSFRRAILCLDIDEKNPNETNVVKTLMKIMMEYENAADGCINPMALRKELSVFYKYEKLFAEGVMSDAEEAMLALLGILHKQTAYMGLTAEEKNALHDRKLRESFNGSEYIESSDDILNPRSITDMIFSHQIYDRFICSKCDCHTEWDLFSNLIFNVYATEFTNGHYSKVEELICSLPGNLSHLSKCVCEKCSSVMQIERILCRLPMVFVISLMWETSETTGQQVKDFLTTISGLKLDMKEAFRFSKDITVTEDTTSLYKFRGFVCYYGRHYLSFFYSTVHRTWLLFDDQQVKQVGTWADVIRRCFKARYQPVLLFYEIPDTRKDSSVGLFNDVDAPSSHSYKEAEGAYINESSKLMSIKEDVTDPIEPPHNHTRSEDNTSEDVSPANGNPRNSSENIPVPAPAASISISDRWIMSKYQHAVHPSLAMLPRESLMKSPCKPDEYDVEFSADMIILGLYLEKVNDALCITKFPRGPNNEIFGAEKSGRIGLFDRIIQANGYSLQHYSIERALDMIKAQRRPLIIRFQKSIEVAQLMTMGFPYRICIDALVQTNGDLEEAANLCTELSKY